jgi:hypothetical protein
LLVGSEAEQDVGEAEEEDPQTERETLTKPILD